jgi:hypothetical protein
LQHREESNNKKTRTAKDAKKRQNSNSAMNFSKWQIPSWNNVIEIKKKKGT